VKIAFLGMGEVARCCLHLFDSFIKTDPRDIVIAERTDVRSHPAVNAFITRGAQYVRVNLQNENLSHVLHHDLGLKPGDLVIDLLTDSDVFSLTEFCLQNNFLYLNTCIENAADNQLIHHINHDKMNRLLARYRHRRALATCIFDHGMNPGLISSFVKQGLIDIAGLVLANGRRSDLRHALAEADYSRIAELVTLQTLHCSEIDTQTGVAVPDDVFVNTWSCPGFLVEANAPSQIVRGTHETDIPAGYTRATEDILVSEAPAWSVKARSFVPDEEITGMVIPHEEVITLNKLLRREHYAPTICYVYQINPHTQRCFDQGITAEADSLVITPAVHSLAGYDKVGALFLLRENPVSGEKRPYAYWCGTILKTFDHLFSATVIQVAAGVLSAAQYMIEHPRAGIFFPEDLPHEHILQAARPHLGQIYSAPVDFFPSGTGFENFIFAAKESPAHLLR